jgi:hypothetical protein
MLRDDGPDCTKSLSALFSERQLRLSAVTLGNAALNVAMVFHLIEKPRQL